MMLIKEKDLRMSEGTKKAAEQIKKFFEDVSYKAEQASKSIPDKELCKKLQRVKETSQEVVKHIEEKTNNG